MSPSSPSSLLRSDSVRVHNDTRTGPGLEFTSNAAQWNYVVSVPVLVAPPPAGDLETVISVTVEVLEGMIGVGITDASLQDFISSEIDVTAAPAPRRIELRPASSSRHVHVMIRKTAPGVAPVRFRLMDLSVDYQQPDRRLLVPGRFPEIPVDVSGTVERGTFDILISHSSRTWNAEQCDRDYLARRYARPGRLEQLPPFDSLPANAAPYHGLLTVFRVSLTANDVRGQVLQHCASPEKVVHAAFVGERAVVCFDAGVALFAYRADASQLEIIPDTAERLVDPWFGGLHTVVGAGGATCLVSSSGADAILWIDVEQKTVTRRWRLPASRYGTNYALDETTSLSDHYISNDLQLGHLNCACPDGAGGAFFSTLAQGDIGWLHADGRCEILVTGYIGCHGIRYDSAAKLLYFSDSCRGRLMRVDRAERATVIFETGSRWLHDAIHIGNGIFLLTLGDRNRLLLADTNTQRTLAEWDFGIVGGSIQFLSLAREGTNA